MFFIKGSKNKSDWSETSYVPFQLEGHICKRTLSSTIYKNGISQPFSCSVTGDDVCYSQKCSIAPIKFQQEIKYNYLMFILFSALYHLGNRHICLAITCLADDLNGKPKKIQCYNVKDIFNREFHQHPIYTLDEASVIVKKTF